MNETEKLAEASGSFSQPVDPVKGLRHPSQMPRPEISTTAKGNQLEEAFVKWMEDYGYHSIIHGQGQKISYIGGNYKPDILASRFNHFWIFLTIIATGCVIAWLCLAFFNTIHVINHPGLLLVSYIIAIPLAFVGMTKCKIRYWVECKNWKKSIDRSVVQNLYASIAVAKNKKGGIWEGILVSHMDFRNETLELASHLRIHCYQWTENEFKRIKFTEPEPNLLEPYA